MCGRIVHIEGLKEIKNVKNTQIHVPGCGFRFGGDRSGRDSAGCLVKGWNETPSVGTVV